MRIRLALLVVGLNGCAANPAVIVPISAGPPCHARLNGQDLDAEGLGRAIKAMRPQPEQIVFVADSDVPYRCVGGMIYLAQMAGVGEVSLKVR